MDESTPPDPIAPLRLEYLSARVRAPAPPQAEAKPAAPLPVLPARYHPTPFGQRIKWLGISLIVLAVVILAANSVPDPRHDPVVREKCEANLRTIGFACMVYGDISDGKLPDSFPELLRTTRVTNDIFVCPATGDKPAVGTIDQQAAALADHHHVSYIWIGRKPRTNFSRDTLVLAYEPLQNHDNTGMHVLFYDFHVEWLDPVEGRRLISSIVPGEPTIWPPAGSKP